MEAFEEALAAGTQKSAAKVAHGIIVAAIDSSGTSDLQTFLSNVVIEGYSRGRRRIHLQKHIGLCITPARCPDGEIQQFTRHGILHEDDHYHRHAAMCRTRLDHAR
jgi:hypothetical protein